jgi:hypothetical protein
MFESFLVSFAVCRIELCRQIRDTNTDMNFNILQYLMNVSGPDIAQKVSTCSVCFMEKTLQHEFSTLFELDAHSSSNTLFYVSGEKSFHSTKKSLCV